MHARTDVSRCRAVPRREVAAKVAGIPELDREHHFLDRHRRMFYQLAGSIETHLSQETRRATSHLLPKQVCQTGWRQVHAARDSADRKRLCQIETHHLDDRVHSPIHAFGNSTFVPWRCGNVRSLWVFGSGSIVGTKSP
jgi:hypothetical protein